MKKVFKKICTALTATALAVSTLPLLAGCSCDPATVDWTFVGYHYENRYYEVGCSLLDLTNPLLSEDVTVDFEKDYTFTLVIDETTLTGKYVYEDEDGQTNVTLLIKETQMVATGICSSGYFGSSAEITLGDITFEFAGFEEGYTQEEYQQTLEYYVDEIRNAGGRMFDATVASDGEDLVLTRTTATWNLSQTKHVVYELSASDAFSRGLAAKAGACVATLYKQYEMIDDTQDDPKYEYVEYLIIFYVEPIAGGAAYL